MRWGTRASEPQALKLLQGLGYYRVGFTHQVLRGPEGAPTLMAASSWPLTPWGGQGAL